MLCFYGWGMYNNFLLYCKEYNLFFDDLHYSVYTVLFLSRNLKFRFEYYK